jgi:hypothetical protein
MISETWNQGEFIVNINHCVLKSKALSYILEDQAEFGALEFNRLGLLLK